MLTESTLSPTDVAFLLAQQGIRASRDRIARMADELYERDSEEAGRHRRFSHTQVDELAAAFLIIEGGASREDAARMLRDPTAAVRQIRAEADARIEALRRIRDLPEAMTA